MKSKIIKKMLAAILVALTVISTPGLASAGPKRRRQGGDGKKQKTFLGKKTKRSQEDEKESKKGYEKEFVEKFEKDFDKWFGYDPAEDDCDLDFFDIGFGEELSKENATPEEIAASEDIFELLVNKYDKKRSELLEKIEKDLKVSSSNSQCSKNEKSDKKSLGIESLFNKDPNTFKQQCKIVAAVVELANSEFFQKFPTKQVVDIAKKFEANLDNQRVIEKLLEKYKKQQLSKIVDILLDRLSDDEEKIAIVEVIADLSGHKFSHMYEQQQITRMVELLIGCGDVKGIKKHIKLALCRLAYWDVLKNCPEKQIFELTDKLVEWLKDDDERDCVADCIGCLAENNLLNNHTQQQIMVILDSLIECANASEKKEDATWAIYHLADRHLLKKCSEEQIARLVDELFKWIEDDNCIYCVADIASCLSDDSLLDSQTKQQIVEMVIKRLESDVAKLMEIMQQFARHGLLKDCSKDRIKKLMDVLLEAVASENGIKYNFGPVFEEFFAADFLKEYSEEQITHIIDVWFKWMDAGVMSVLNKDDSNKDNSNKDNSNKDNSNKDNSNKDDSNKDDSNKDDSNKDDSNKDDSNKDDSNKDNSNKDDSNKDDSNKDDSNKDYSNKDYSNKDDSDYVEAFYHFKDRDRYYADLYARLSAQREITDTITSLVSRQGALDRFSTKHIIKLTDKLAECLKLGVGNWYGTVESIGKLAEGNFLRGYSPDQIAGLKNVLIECGASYTRERILGVVEKLASNKLISNDEKIDLIAKIEARCRQSAKSSG